MSTASSSSLTVDLTSDILLRLPADSVVRCRYVSKLWSSITTDPYFTNKFETRSSARPFLLMFFREKGKHKVVCLPCAEASDVCRGLTLGSAQESWRTVKTNHKHITFTTSFGRCINGVLYRAYIDVNDSDVGIIMSFDVRTEKLDMIRLQSEDLRGMLIPYEGRLACLDSYNFMDKDGFTLWILEDAEQHQWSFKHFPTPFVRSLENVYKINGVTDAGIADEEFRFSNGLGNGRLRGLFTFPNHVENLMSLKY